MMMAEHALPIVELRGVGKRFGDSEVLRKVDLSIQRSEVVCIIGPSGSGKSTLLRCIAALEEHTEGEILIEGKPLGFSTDAQGRRLRLSETEIAHTRRNVGMVFQQFNLWPHMTALGNVVEALRLVRKLPRDEADARGMAMLTKVGLAAKAASYPSQLSGGQQQRVAIARTLAMEPHIVLFDEPTSSLDPELTGEVLQVMKDLAREGMTMAVVSHEMGFAAQVADRVVFIDHGTVLAQGTPDLMFRSPPHPRLAQFIDNYMSRVAWALPTTPVS
jgi:polar amino acid transport system ATP-binding protein